MINIIKTIGGIKKEDIESKVEELNQRENINDINKEIIEIINKIKANYIAEGISLGISEQNFVEENDELLPDPDTKKNDENNIDIHNLNPSYILKFLYNCHEDKSNNLFKPSLSKETIKNIFSFF